MAIEIDGADSDKGNDTKSTPAAEQTKTQNSDAPAQQQAAPANDGGTAKQPAGNPSFGSTTKATAARAPAVETGAKNTTSNSTPNPQGQRTAMISSRHNYGMSRAATSQAMRSIVEVIDKIAEGEVEQPVKFSFYSLDGEKEGLLISALVVAATLKDAGNGQKYVAHHTLLLAATAKGATTVEQQFGQGIKYERLVIPADAYDSTMRARVADIIQGAHPGFTLIDADATVVPTDLDLRSEEAVRNVIANATTATSTLLASVVANDGWVITPEIAAQTFQNEIKASHDHFVDLTGQPVRGDVVLEMSMLTGKNQNSQANTEFQYNTSQSKRLITQLLGYIDLTSTPPNVGATSFFGGMQNNMVNQAEQLKIYTPRLVITNVDAPDEVCELPVILQGLATTQALCNDARWISALIQQHKNGAAHAENGVNIRDLSAIGLEAPVMAPPLGYQGGELPKQQRLPLQSANINEAMLAAAIQTYCRETLLVSMDVPECEAASWILSPFAAAARGDQQAIRDLFDAADMLTGGKFTPIYKGANGNQMKPPVYNDNMFVNLGYYHSARGKRDIRDSDYLTVLNLTGDSELDTINDWANLQANVEVDPMFRLAETRAILQRLYESMTITGRAVRITFNPTFIYALAAAVAEAGLVYETKIGMASPQGTARMVVPYMRNLPTGLGNAGAFVASGMRRAASGSAGAGSFGRYAHANTGGNTNLGGAGNY